METIGHKCQYCGRWSWLIAATNFREMTREEKEDWSKAAGDGKKVVPE